MTGDKFKVGDIVILRNLKVHPEFNGLETSVTGACRLREPWNGPQVLPFAFLYEVDVDLPGCESGLLVAGNQMCHKAVAAPVANRTEVPTSEAFKLQTAIRCRVAMQGENLEDRRGLVALEESENEYVASALADVDERRVNLESALLWLRSAHAAAPDTPEAIYQPPRRLPPGDYVMTPDAFKIHTASFNCSLWDGYIAKRIAKLRGCARSDQGGSAQIELMSLVNERALIKDAIRKLRVLYAVAMEGVAPRRSPDLEAEQQ